MALRIRTAIDRIRTYAPPSLPLLFPLFGIGIRPTIQPKSQYCRRWRRRYP